MTNILRKFLIFLLVLTGADAYSSKYAGEFMSLGFGAKAKGMGSAFVSVGQGVEMGYWNPAGLVSGGSDSEILFMHSEPFKSLAVYDFLGYSRILNKSKDNSDRASLYLGLMRTGINNIPLTELLDPDAPPIKDNGEINFKELGMKNANDYVFYVSYGQKLSEKKSAGCTLKLIYRDVVGYSAKGLGFNLGYFQELGRGIKFGANARDIITSVMWWQTGEREHVMPNLDTGISWSFRKKASEMGFIVACDTDIEFEGRKSSAQLGTDFISADFHLGAEFRLNNKIAVRGGLDRDILTAGATLTIGPIDVDYAFSSHQDLNETHWISAKFRLGQKGLFN